MFSQPKIIPLQLFCIAAFSYSRIAVSPGCALERLSRKISGNATSATSIISLKSSA